ncbi:MAG: DNA mismatch repair endonuclease MutL, partial [Planctomycetia bacterium]|nr:DNA mismatch repair endonuclease MutL [Planctomycetia bacterium]
TRIELVIERSGTDLVQVIDNGCGIASEQLILALSPHATSKIADADDLFRIRTFGFRGEALASVAEVSQLVLRSQTEDSPEGAEIRSDGGTLSGPVPVGTSRGTSIEVRNLFFNVPARRKFLKSPGTEFGHISEAFNRVAIPNPAIHFVFKHNGRVVQDLPPASQSRERIGRLFGTEIGERLIYVESQRGDVSIQGFVAHPDCSRPNNSLQYIFLNRRYIRDRSLQHALTEAYRGLLPVGRFPIAFVNINIPPDFVDVNVHPTKLEVRFVNSSPIYSGFLGAIREEFLRSDLNSRPGIADNRPAATRQGAPVSPPSPYLSDQQDAVDPRSAMDDEASEAMRKQILSWSNGDLEQTQLASGQAVPSDIDLPSGPISPKASGDPNSNDQASDDPDSEVPFDSAFPPQHHAVVQQMFPMEPASRDYSNTSLKLNRITPVPRDQRPTQESHTEATSFEDIFAAQRRAMEFEQAMARRNTGPASDEIDASENESIPAAILPPAKEHKPVLQIHDRYLVTQTDEGLAIIDQHALHERILYEKIKARMEAGKMDSQQLLVPEPVDLTPTELACVLENRELLADFGLQVDSFGGNTVLVSGYPAIVRDTSPGEILMLLLNPLLESGRKPKRTDLLDEMMHQMACKAAVKAGDNLTPDDIDELLNLAQAELNVHHCPHGRPSTLVFSCVELDKMFKRT